MHDAVSSGSVAVARGPSKSARAFERLQQMIVTLVLEPGEILREYELAERIGAGRTPLREAIRRLGEMGLVVIRPNQSPQVAPIDIFEIGEVVELRTVLETTAARLAAMRATAGDRAAITAANEAYRAAVEGNDMAGAIETDFAFHRAVALAAHNRHLLEALRLNSGFNLRLWTLAMRRSGRLTQLGGQHDPIASAILAGDPAAAETAMTDHIGLFRQRLSGLITEAGGPAA